MDFIQEVQDELKQERAVVFFKRYGNYIIAAVAGIILATIVTTWWEYHKHQQSIKGAEAFYAANQAISDEQNPSNDAMKKLAEQGSGYGALARFTLAQRALDNEAYEEAFAAYQAVITETDDVAIADLAQLQAIKLHLSKQVGTVDDIDGILAALAADDAPYALSARELQIMRLIAQGKEQEAREISQWMTAHPAFSATMKERLDILLPSENPFGIAVNEAASE